MPSNGICIGAIAKAKAKTRDGSAENDSYQLQRAVKIQVVRRIRIWLGPCPPEQHPMARNFGDTKACDLTLL